jgi:hypothetical protein
VSSYLAKFGQEPISAWGYNNGACFGISFFLYYLITKMTVQFYISSEAIKHASVKFVIFNCFCIPCDNDKKRFDIIEVKSYIK